MASNKGNKIRTIGIIYANHVTIPTISGYGAEIVCNIVEREGYHPILIDLVKDMYPDTDWKTSERWRESIREHLRREDYSLLLISMRNASMTYFSSFFQDNSDNGSFLPWYKAVAEEISNAGFPLDKVVAGGVGFGTMPNHILNITGIGYGLVGAAEQSLGEVIDKLCSGRPDYLISGLVERSKPFIPTKRVLAGAPKYPIKRKYFNNKWYENNGGTIALRLDHGCLMNCAYCAEPDSKGDLFRQDLENILFEFDDLYQQGIRYIQFADSELNFNPSLKKAFLRRVISEGYQGVKFAVYMQPAPVDEEFISLLAAAGCDGINFCSDNINAELLRTGFNKRWYARTEEEPKEAITRAERLCKQYGIRTKHEILIGMPGDTEDNVKENLDFFMTLNPEVIGLTVGIGVLPSSPLFKDRIFLDAVGDLDERKISVEGLIERGIYTTGEIGYDGATYFVSPALKIPEIFFDIETQIGQRTGIRFHSSDFSAHNQDNSLPFNPAIREKLNRGLRGVEVNW
jgi:hypothetical protein